MRVPCQPHSATIPRACPEPRNPIDANHIIFATQNREAGSRYHVTVNLPRWSFVCAALGAALACTRNEASPPKTAPKTETVVEAAPERAPVDLEGRAFPLVIASALVVEEGYFDRGRFAPRRQLASALESLGMQEPAFFGAIEGQTMTTRAGRVSHDFALSTDLDLREAADTLESVLVFCRDALSLRPDQVRELEYAAINGFLAPLDPHTVLLTPEERTELGVRTSGRYGGIGAEIASRERRIAVIDVLPDTPAERAGLLAGDIILKVGNQATVNMTATDAMQLVRGPVGSTVRLEIRRGKQRLTLTVTRQIIKIDSVRAADLGDGVAYIGLSHFQEDSAEKMVAAINGFSARPKAIVLDLRGNSGGLLTEATEVLDAFVDRGELVIVHSSAGREALEAKINRPFGPELSVVALIDEHSASAAEIVSGAIKHLGRGLVIGRSSFGKGSVQKLLPLHVDERPVALKQTIAEYRVAGERKIQTVGVQPDLNLLPVRLSSFPGVAQYDDRERFERARERYRTASLPSAVHEHGATALVGPPAPELRYFDSPPTKPVTEMAARLMTDHEIRLAQMVAARLHGKPSRHEMLSALSPLIEKLNAAEDAKLVTALRERKIDWSSSTAAVPNLRLQAKLGHAGAVAAGSPFELELTVHNDGSAAAHRVRTLTDCPLDELDGIELLFGRLDPGQSATRKLSLEVMAWHPDFSDELNVGLFANDDRQRLATADVTLEVTAQPRPQLAFDHWIVDDPKLVRRAPKRGAVDMDKQRGAAFSVTGNGDGMLGQGECVLLAFRVHNRGPGPSADTRMMVRNLSGTQGLLEEGLFDLDTIAPTKSADGAFGFCVAKDADPKRPVELVFTAADARLRERTDQNVELRVVDERATFVAKRERVVVGEHKLRLYNGADASAAIVDLVDPHRALEVIGRAGPWSALAGGAGRRLWAPSDLLTVQRPTGPVYVADATWLVDPPQIGLDPVATRPTATRVTLRGTVTARRGVRDVVVYQTTNEAAARPHKTSFQAAEATQTEIPLPFAFDIDLAPGGNRLIVEARDAQDVVAQREVWVYRDGR
ncbi:MAG: PDZ domain-containing protein [Myxococcales bacterium FL481]|nr:MAG: PDZ domain-containing protein [Myxococcales bacterium FL481]